MPPNGVRRRFGIRDGLLVVAGLAAGLALVKATTPHDVSPEKIRDAFLRPEGGWTVGWGLSFALDLCVVFAIPAVVGWTPACLLLQLTGRRPPFRRLRRQPGFVACLVSTVVVAAATCVALALIACGVRALHQERDRRVMEMILGGAIAGNGVLWSWTAMWLCRACRWAPTWTDRLGRATGVIWILLGIGSMCYLALMVLM